MQLTERDIGNACKPVPKWWDTCTASVIDALCNQPTCGTPTQLFDACRTAEFHRFRDGEPILLDVNRIGSVSSVPQGGLAASPVAAETVDQVAMRQHDLQNGIDQPPVEGDALIRTAFKE